MMLDAKTLFCPDRYPQPLIGIAAELQRHAADLHQHQRGQLLWPQQGSMQLIVSQRQYSVTPAHVIWIPPQVQHGVAVPYHASYRSVYIVPELCCCLPNHLVMLRNNRLLNALLDRISLSSDSTDWHMPVWQRLQTVLFDELVAAESELISYLPLPTDRRLAHLSKASVLPSLQALARSVGASEKTISRICQRELGLGYRDWRQQVHMATARTQLLAGHAIGDISHSLGFSSDSAFITCFKRIIGQTPHQYRQHHSSDLFHMKQSTASTNT